MKRASLLAFVAAGLIACGKTPATESSSGHGSSKQPSTGESWVRLLGDLNPQGANAVALDDAGNVFAAGYACGRRVGLKYADGSIDFGGGARSTVGECDLFVAKYAASGGLGWSYLEGEDGLMTRAHAIALLASAHVLVAGSRGREMLLDELGADGKLVASHRFRDPTGGDGYAIANAVVVAADGDWIVAGEGFKRIDLGTGPLEHVGTVPFVARYGPDGKARWVRYANVVSTYVGKASAVAIAHNTIYTCGTTDGPRGDGTGAGAFVQALDGTTGEPQWTKMGVGDCDALAIVGDGIVSNVSIGDDATLTALSRDGAMRWKLASTPDGLSIHSLAVDDGVLLAVGRQHGNEEVRLLELDAKGAVVKSKIYRGKLAPRGIASASHVVVLGGQLVGRVDLGVAGSVETATAPIEDSTNSDAVVARLTAPW